MYNSSSIDRQTMMPVKRLRGIVGIITFRPGVVNLSDSVFISLEW